MWKECINAINIYIHTPEFFKFLIIKYVTLFHLRYSLPLSILRKIHPVFWGQFWKLVAVVCHQAQCVQLW